MQLTSLEQEETSLHSEARYNNIIKILRLTIHIPLCGSRLYYYTVVGSMLGRL